MSEMEREKPNIHDADTDEFEAVSPTEEFEPISSGEVEVNGPKAVAMIVALILIVAAFQVEWGREAVAWIFAIIMFVFLVVFIAWAILRVFAGAITEGPIR